MTTKWPLQLPPNQDRTGQQVTSFQACFLESVSLVTAPLGTLGDQIEEMEGFLS